MSKTKQVRRILIVYLLHLRNVNKILTFHYVIHECGVLHSSALQFCTPQHRKRLIAKYSKCSRCVFLFGVWRQGLTV